jgi:hypothetical protein
MSRPVSDFGPRPHVVVGCLFWGIRLFMVPHLIMWLVLLSFVPASLLWALCGRDYNAPITAVERTTSRRNGSPTYWGQYVLDVDGHTLRAKVDVGEAVYRRAQISLGQRGPHAEPVVPPATIRVRVVTWGPFYYQQHLRVGEGVWGQVAFTAFASLFASGIVGTFFYQFYVRPWRESRRFRHDTERFLRSRGPSA